jgi:hypothetical protein
MSLVNSSQVIGSADLSGNASVNMLRFYINSADIIINGTTYNVTVPSGQITATLTGNARINSNSEAFIDLSPTVAAIYTQNSTVFVMVPSVKAIIVPGGNSSVSLPLGSKQDLNSTDKAELRVSNPNITITSISLGALNNVTSFSVTVKNNANTSVEINHIILFGNISVSVNPNQVDNAHGAVSTNDSAKASAKKTPTDSQSGGITTVANLSISGHANTSYNSSNTSGNSDGGISAHINGSVSSGFSSNGREDNGIHVLPLNANLSSNASLSSDVNELVKTGIMVKTFKTTVFMVSSNGTLTLPASEHEFEGNGYTLSPLASATFTYDGNMTLAEGHITASVVLGRPYTIVVRGQDGIAASANVTATAG